MTSPKPPEPDQERGIAVDRNTIFGEWSENDWLLDPSKPTDRQLDRMFERDGKARQLEQALTLPLRSAELRYEKTDGDRGELEHVREALTRPANSGGMSTPLWQVLAQATSALSHRRAFFEKVWTVRDDQFAYDKLAWRPQGSCKIKRGKRGEFEGFKQYVGHDHPGADKLGEITIEPQNAWVFLHGAHRDPLSGISDFDVAWNNHLTKQKLRYIYFALFLENSALPKTAVKVREQDDHKAAAKKVAGLRNGGVVGVHKDWDFFTFPTGAGEPFAQALAYLDADSAASVLAGFTNLTDPGKNGGSYALSESAQDFFLMSQQAKLVELAGSLTSWVAADLCRWNFGPDSAVPQLSFAPLSREDVTPALSALQTAATSQQTIPSGFTDLLVEEVAKRLGLPADKVASAIRQAQQQAPPTEAGQVGAAADATGQIIQQQAA